MPQSIDTMFRRTRIKIFPNVHSLSSKFLLSIIHFPSQTPKEACRHHFHTTALFGLPKDHQQSYISPTRLGITQDIPKRLKKALQMAEATSQWRRRWSTDSSFLLHMQHLSITMMCHLLRLSKVNVLPRATNHTKKNYPRRSLSPPYTLLGEEDSFRKSQRAIEGFDLEQSFFGWSPPQLIFTSSSHSNWIQHLEKRSKDIYLPTMHHSSKAHIPLVGAAQKL
jgi:hypothetical protein